MTLSGLGQSGVIRYIPAMKEKDSQKKALLSAIVRLGQTLSDRNEYLLESARTIQNHFPLYNWVGFYFLEKDNRLHVGPYVGKVTPHTVIDLDKGICGVAVSQEQTIVVDDVNADPRYLACSLETRSEIVIPIKVRGRIIGELDIDSQKKAAFSPPDRQMLEEVAEIIGKALEKF